MILSGARRKEQRWDPKENEQIETEGMNLYGLSQKTIHNLHCKLNLSL